MAEDSAEADSAVEEVTLAEAMAVVILEEAGQARVFDMNTNITNII